uniref:Apoptosis-inducing factor 3-like n=1 Tax=Sinocyclocheilus anshuiensis TaxID=1608454 RepID=A0A671M2U3_9TELE
MKEVEVDQNKILLVCNNGEFTTVGGLCTHYGAPLIKGALLGDRVRCPFHGACFNTKTGDIEEFPGLDCLPKYKVKVEGGKVYVTTDKKKLKKRVKKMCGRVPGVTHTVALIGGGPASLQCAETLRQNDYGGRIIMVTKDEQLPLDKTKLSKAMNIEIEKVLLRQNDFLQQHGIEVWTKKEVLISLLLKMLEEKNVTFYTSNGVAEIRGKNGKVKEVVLKNGEVLPADIVIVGIGVIPNSDFLKETSVEIDSRSAVVVDKFMKTNIPDVFAAGDVVSFPLPLVGHKRVNTGHWQLAQAHGRISGLSMLNQQVAINTVPYFWTMLLGKSIRYTGYGEGYTDIVFKGSTEERKFLVFYIKDEEVAAAASLNFDPAVARLAEMLLMGKRITKAQAHWLQLP